MIPMTRHERDVEADFITLLSMTTNERDMEDIITLISMAKNERVDVRGPRSDMIWCCCCSLRRIAKLTSFHGVISTMLLPLTIRGSIGGQYGTLITSNIPNEGPQALADFSDISYIAEYILIILLFLSHLIGCISVIKDNWVGMIFYLFVRAFECYLSLLWTASVSGGFIKSHVMSQDVLEWYCFIPFLIEVISIQALFLFAIDHVTKDKYK